MKEGTDYDLLEFALEVLGVVGFRRSEQAVATLSQFLRSVGNRELQHPEHLSGWGDSLSKYRGPHTLISKAIKVLSGLRYLETRAVTDVLLWAAAHSEESVRKSATEGLRTLAKYNLSVFYGTEDDSRQGMGAAPQIAVLNTLESKESEFLIENLSAVLTLLEGLLSTSMESARWSSTAVTLTRAVTPAEGEIPSVRRRSLDLLKRIYGLAETKSQKLAVIRTLNAATRAESRSAVDKDYAEMIATNAQEVLGVFAQIAEREPDLQIVQKIEHDSYWIHYHSPSGEVRSAALAVKAIIDANAEYAIYKVLVGFEGIFSDWSDSRREGSYSVAGQDRRVEDAKAMASRIPDDGFDVWKQRVLTFAQTESNDMATFPVFYEFLAEVAGLHPDFALNLLASESERLSRFLIPLLRGVWDGSKRSELLPLMETWIQNASLSNTSPLYACAKLFLSTKTVDMDVLERILVKAVELKDPHVMRQVASVGIARSTDSDQREELKNLFLSALDELTKLRNANWVSDIWYRKEVKEAVAEFSMSERQRVLNNLRFLPLIDYQAEDVLAVIARREPADVVDFLCARVYKSDEMAKAEAENDGDRYEELPYQFHSLNEPLAANPAMVVQKVLDWYRRDSSLFLYRGAKLLQLVFPEFPEAFQASLVRLIRTAGGPELEFVSNVLRAYNGQSFILPVARQLIQALSPESELVNEVEIALQSTGVVSGEYGMSEAYERKRLEVLDWLQDPHERVRAFAAKYIADLEAMRDAERRRADESITLRKFEYGEE
ncbi:hypothetical protein [Pelomonas sp. Root1217]|uniref:hypothetical protein n=1 Tax=Pelomonas sp. Root1217 TaxID=1736430 RepID=UPI00138F7B83|nr:hypothetical protein [Pelomonas sp. Root1217]